MRQGWPQLSAVARARLRRARTQSTLCPAKPPRAHGNVLQPCHPETRDYLARKRSEGKSISEAIRCLKRHLARRIWHLLQPPN